MRSRLKRHVVRYETRVLLEGLGSTADDVASALAHSGVHGIPLDGSSCVLSRYVYAVIGGDRSVRSVLVGSDGVRITARGPMRRILVPLPPAVQQFVAEFDRGTYVELIDGSIDRNGLH